MITFITEEKLANLQTYHKTEKIPEEEFTSFIPNRYIIQFGMNEQTYSYLESISEKAAYVAQLLESYVMIRNEAEFFEKQEKEDSKLFYQYGRNLDLRIFRDSLYENDLNYKEKLATNRINTGRRIYSKLKELLVYGCIDYSLEKFIAETKNSLCKLPDKSIMETDYYKEVLPEEDDIFHYYLIDSQQLIEPLIQEYFVANSYFTNKGKSVFVVKPEYYLYLVGTARGEIPENRKFYYFKNDYKNGFMEAIISDLRHLNEEIQQNLAFHIYNQNQENKKKIDDFSEINNHELYKIMFEQLKQQSTYKTISSFLGIENCDKTFFAFFNLRYLIFFDNKLEFHGALKQNVFYNILKSKIFIFSDYYDVIKAPLDELFKRDIGDFRQDNGEPAKWKMIVDSLIKAVPYNHEIYEREFK